MASRLDGIHAKNLPDYQLNCTDENVQLVVEIGDQRLSLEEFGRMLTMHAGWGMRIEFVPEDQLYQRPALEVREPAADEFGEG